ncbi:hypothetical protein PILCRDRAFT_776389 [Piloderma croceum F 1598]|uniref:Uncharacterized protein n=1 Tax=Piloderma croceum (strain F 1598) TaxID=765440 RepID=A0A0C3C914_PILCF|nr:hypothetical protein PILCRDRAFT_776389 [Piloderma croceum F 1598]
MVPTNPNWEGPWHGQVDNAIPSRSLMCAILATLYNLGWTTLHSKDVSKKQLDKDTILFRHQATPVPPWAWFSISFNKGDLLRLIHAPQEMTPAFLSPKSFCSSSYIFNNPDAISEFKCNGYPWFVWDSEAVSIRVLLLSMFYVLEVHGFKLYISLD